MSLEEERAFLKSHTDLLERPGIGSIHALKQAFESRVGRTIHKTTIYRLLERHGRKAEAAGEAARPPARRRLPAGSRGRKAGGR